MRRRLLLLVLPLAALTLNPEPPSWSADEAAAAAVVKSLREGEPSIGIRSEGNALVIGVWMMQAGEDKVVARRLRQVLEKRA